MWDQRASPPSAREGYRCSWAGQSDHTPSICARGLLHAACCRRTEQRLSAEVGADACGMHVYTCGETQFHSGAPRWGKGHVGCLTRSTLQPCAAARLAVLPTASPHSDPCLTSPCSNPDPPYPSPHLTPLCAPTRLAPPTLAPPLSAPHSLPPPPKSHSRPSSPAFSSLPLLSFARLSSASSLV